MPSWMNGQAMRCGPLTQAAQIFTAHLSIDRDPPKGPEGLLALAKAVEHHLTQPDDEERDRLFVELAGAYLALLLCDGLGQGEHTVRAGRHGLRLGRDEFFDPFAAIGRVLLADQTRAALAREVARAELQARGGTGRPPSASWDQLRSQLLPRLVGPRFLSFLEQRFSDAPVYLAPLAGEVRVAFIVRSGHAARYLRKDEVRHCGLGADQIRRAALENLASRSAAAQLVRCEGERGVLVVGKTGDGLDSSRLLLPGLHDVLAPELGSPFAVAVPHRDALFACSMADSHAVQDLRDRANHEAQRAAQSISDQLFAVGPAGALQLVD
jgi:hypothetical protein